LPDKKTDINEIARRIIDLSAIHPSSKEFLEQCKIANHSLITDLKHKRIKNPGAHILAQIVKGTGCSGSWLLTGKGKMFDTIESNVDDGGVSYVRIRNTDHLLEEFEKRIRRSKKDENWNKMTVKVSKLLVRMLEYRISNSDK